MLDTVLDALESGDMSHKDMERIYAAIGEAVYAQDDWRGDKPYTIVVAGETFNMKLVGLRQIDAVQRLRLWLRDNIGSIMEEFGDTDALKGLGAGEGANKKTADNISAIVSLLDPELFVGLGHVLTGFSDEVVREHFDLNWIIGAAEMMYQANPFIQRVTRAFFTR